MTDESPDPSAQPVSRIAALQATAKARTAEATEWAARLRERSVMVEAAFVIYERDRVSAGSVLGSAIAFRLFLFFVPTVVFGVGLLGAISGYVEPDTVTDTASLTGALADQVRTALSQSSTAAYLTLLSGLFLMVTAGRSLAKALVASSSLVWLTGGKVTAKVRIVAIVIGLSASLTLTSLVTSRIRNEFGLAATGLSFGLSLVLYALILVVLMAALPRRTPDPGALLPGAVLASLVLNGLLAVSQFYLPRQFSGASELYGGIGVTVVTLGWLFFVGRILALSFAMNAALFDRFGSLSQGVFSLPMLRSLPPRSERVRNYFGLDADGRSVESSPPSEAVVDEQFLTGIESRSDAGRAEDPA
ncbi:MAG TPA: YihY/virulence factor BrkB family protein [Ilumatobacteraceae bacterium]|nr:YihY/virulence factor BrkB family protein [Ilumatobacteraceae bacterium]